MAATRIMPIHLNKGGTPAKALSDVIGYVGNPEKTDKGYLISSFHCSKETAAADFMLLRQTYLQRTGWTPKKGKEILAYHVRQSFSPGEITPREANRLGQEFARRFTKTNTQSSFVPTSIKPTSIIIFDIQGAFRITEESGRAFFFA